jgi:hypothetical protein
MPQYYTIPSVCLLRYLRPLVPEDEANTSVQQCVRAQVALTRHCAHCLRSEQIHELEQSTQNLITGCNAHFFLKQLNLTTFRRSKADVITWDLSVCKAGTCPSQALGTSIKGAYSR